MEIISNTDANFLNLRIDKARKTHDDKQLYWQQMIIAESETVKHKMITLNGKISA